MVAITSVKLLDINGNFKRYCVAMSPYSTILAYKDAFNDLNLTFQQQIWALSCLAIESDFFRSKREYKNSATKEINTSDNAGAGFFQLSLATTYRDFSRLIGLRVTQSVIANDIELEIKAFKWWAKTKRLNSVKSLSDMVKLWTGKQQQALQKAITNRRNALMTDLLTVSDEMSYVGYNKEV